MDRRGFIGVTSASILAAGGAFYLFSDKNNFIRSDINETPSGKFFLRPEEREILYLASLAPSGHNAQPWFVKYIEPYHWIIGNDKRKWLPAVDPRQRETILSIGAFMQSLEYATLHHGYICEWNILASSNQDENIAEVRLIKQNNSAVYDISKIKNRRTVRSNYLNDVLKRDHIIYLIGEEPDYFHYLPNNTKEYRWVNEQTIEANKIQMNRDDAEWELANWIRFSSRDAKKYCDGLTTAGMEMNGITGWVVRNFFGRNEVMKKSFKNQTIKKVKDQVTHSAGWIIVTGKNNSVALVLDAGKRMQRLFLKVRDKGIALHPTTQILEEFQSSKKVNEITGLTDDVHFILRTGYIKKYPEPVSLRRPVDWFIRT